MKQHPGVDIVTINADLVPNSAAAALSMLREPAWRPPTIGCSTTALSRLRYEIDPAWQGEIPRTILISGDGTIATIEGSAEMTELKGGRITNSPRLAGS